MRTETYILWTCLVPVIFLGYGCGDSSEGKIVVLPQGDRSVACIVHDGRPIPIQDLPFPSTAAVPAETRRPLNTKDSMRVVASAFDLIDYGDNGWITYTAAMGSVIMVLKYDRETGVSRREDIALPVGYAAAASAIVDDIMYIGCRQGDELLGYYDLSSDDPSWVSMDAPDSIARFGLSVGGLVLEGDRLIAVTISNFEPGTLDDAEYAKVFLTYDISDRGAPVLQDAMRAREPGPKERVLKTVAGSRWLATFSETNSFFGRGYVKHIILYERSSLREYAIMSNIEEKALGAAFRNEDMSEFLIWETIGMLGDILLVAARDRGMAIIDPAQIDTTMLRRLMADSLAGKLEYVKFVAYPESHYFNFMSVPPLDKIAAIISRKDSLDFVLLSREELLTPELWIDD